MNKNIWIVVSSLGGHPRLIMDPYTSMHCLATFESRDVARKYVKEYDKNSIYKSRIVKFVKEKS